MSGIDSCLRLAIAAAEKARQAIQSDNGRDLEKEVGRDIKLVADKLAERAVLDHLVNNSEFSVLSEESGEIRRGTEHRWIVDPLDGTFNFYREIPFYCTSIALWNGDEPLLGVILDHRSGELFSGIVGKGATLNGKDIRVSTVSKRDGAVLCTGFPVSANYSRSALGNLVDAAQEFKKIRMFGSAALSLAYVASGRADAYGEQGIRMWDVAAGVALVLAAGGQVRYDIENDGVLSFLEASNGVGSLPNFLKEV